ncbi:MAG: HAD family hydrolase [Candidatus Hydrogenedentota bacterium]|uniref:HAD-superfamily hydrolase, subfamily IA, variant 1 n=1 Tax=Sumerlaea chitinivorans TaxID=2250252 RepID=A0A2Z4YAG5_SUMC1|nr:HAD-superfamily hydrolase, subfamily IA, variant 1 [Candidatus Sumerlaea chitinivorans]RMH24074.1 MAG: HAD family hydrolase [Candidatus Hydrogenedentota bacterium]GIX43745.1 MAG: hypothetical protein KatS3mg130_0153 [Candidatus Sumerlaea sp.]
MRTGRFEWVFFDAGGTLLGTNPDQEHWYEHFFIEACAEQGYRPCLEEVHAALNHAAATCRVHPRCSTPEQVRAYWQHIYTSVFAHLLPQRDATALANHYIERFERGEFVELFADTLPALEILRKRGVRKAIVSNFGTYLEDFLRRCAIAHEFEFAVISAAEGCEKPDPAIFHRALERAGTSPDRVLYVGDSLEEDYHAARAIGLQAVLIDRHDRHRQLQDVRRIRDLREIVQFLQAS